MSVARPETPPEQPANSTKHAYDQVRAAILDGRLTPGSVFSQVQLAAQLGVSRTPLREALRLLENEGLIRASFNRRIEVAPLTLDDLDDLYAARISLESLGVRLTVPQLTESDLAEMQDHLTQMREAARARDMAAVHEPHRLFHFKLYRLSGPRFARQLAELWDHAERYRRLYQVSAAAGLGLIELADQEHVKILELARAGDATGASHLVARHLARTAVTVVAQVDSARDTTKIREALRHVIE